MISGNFHKNIGMEIMSDDLNTSQKVYFSFIEKPQSTLR
ncbi:hypothetical protein J610_0502 [Acinetobacter sp. 723929]|nr:hypothetical protein J610_0502 [Acinetobacter sp. 723929]